jgi:hypothetical protein
MVPLLFLSFTFFILASVTKQHTGLKYVISLLILFVIANTILKTVSGRSAIAVMAKRQHTFLDMSKGGIFLTDSVKFLRLPYNFSLVKLDSSTNEVRATIKKDVSYIYSEFSHQQDTLLCTSNSDTVTRFKVEYWIEPAKQTLNVPHLNDSYLVFVKTLPYALYYTLFKPLFIDVRNTLDIFASVENVLLIACLCLLLIFGFKSKSDKKWCVYFLSIAFTVLVLIGLTSPNPGAIVRYRSLAVPFLIMTTISVVPGNENSSVLKFFKRDSAK